MEIPAAGAIVHDEQGRLLLVRRRFRPEAGRWSVPGGKAMPGEDPSETCVRETREETDLAVAVISIAGCVTRSSSPGNSFAITDFQCRVVSGAIKSGDDASAVGWFTRHQLAQLPLVTGLYATLNNWGLLPE